MREAHVVWTEGGGMTRFPQAGWRVVDALGREHAFFPVTDENLEYCMKYLNEYYDAMDAAENVVGALNAGGAKRERETRTKRS